MRTSAQFCQTCAVSSASIIPVFFHLPFFSRGPCIEVATSPPLHYHRDIASPESACIGSQLFPPSLCACMYADIGSGVQSVSYECRRRVSLYGCAIKVLRRSNDESSASKRILDNEHPRGPVCRQRFVSVQPVAGAWPSPCD